MKNFIRSAFFSLLYLGSIATLNLQAIAQVPAGRAAASSDKPVVLMQSDVTGFWTLDAAASDDPLAKLQELVRRQATAAAGASAAVQTSQSPALTQSLFHPDALVLAAGPGDITINEAYKDVVQTRTLYTDGIARSFRLTPQASFSVAAARDEANGRLVVETVSPRGNRMIETYTVADGGRRLVETLVVSEPGGREIVTLRRTYNRAAADIFGAEEIN